MISDIKRVFDDPSSSLFNILVIKSTTDHTIVETLPLVDYCKLFFKAYARAKDKRQHQFIKTIAKTTAEIFYHSPNKIMPTEATILHLRNIGNEAYHPR